MKLKDVKEYLESLTDDQLEQEALIMVDEDNGFSGGKIALSEFDKDHWFSEDGAFPKDAISKEEFQEYLEYYGDEAKVVFKAGSVFFHLSDSE
jgi:hypothetical protein